LSCICLKITGIAASKRDYDTSDETLACVLETRKF